MSLSPIVLVLGACLRPAHVAIDASKMPTDDTSEHDSADPQDADTDIDTDVPTPNKRTTTLVLSWTI